MRLRTSCASCAHHRTLWQRTLRLLAIQGTALFSALTSSPAGAEDFRDRLLKAYPDHLDRADQDAIYWRDGTRMLLDDGAGLKPLDAWLEAPDIEDMFRFPYPQGAPLAPPPVDADPGRSRAARFFDKMYGDCEAGSAQPHMTEMTWLPKKSPRQLKVSTINGADKRLAAISAELDALPARFDAFLTSEASTFACRKIAGTNRTSAHGHGIAIDIAVAHADYWHWSRAKAEGPLTWRNQIPAEIVAIFERHGFIWGGRWHHFDTMHFEYRPELAPPLAALGLP